RERIVVLERERRVFPDHLLVGNRLQGHLRGDPHLVLLRLAARVERHGEEVEPGDLAGEVRVGARDLRLNREAAAAGELTGDLAGEALLDAAPRGLVDQRLEADHLDAGRERRGLPDERVAASRQPDDQEDGGAARRSSRSSSHGTSKKSRGKRRGPIVPETDLNSAARRRPASPPRVSPSCWPGPGGWPLRG